MCCFMLHWKPPDWSEPKGPAATIAAGNKHWQDLKTRTEWQPGDLQPSRKAAGQPDRRGDDDQPKDQQAVLTQFAEKLVTDGNGEGPEDNAGKTPHSTDAQHGHCNQEELI